MTEPMAKRADQLVVGDRILPEFLPAAAREPGEALYVRLYTYGGDPWVFVAFLLPDGLVEAAHYLPDRKVEVYPAPDATGQLYSRADDGETTQPIAGRTPPHYGAVEVAGGLVEIDPPEGFVPASAPVFACPAHGEHPHDRKDRASCLDCPQCRPPGSTV